MAMALTSTFSNFFDPVNLFGPILGKELRVSSRRRRNYLLRSVYIASLTVFVVVVWLQKAQYVSSSGVYMSSRLATAGKAIVMTIVWFQFCVTQVVAVIMLSAAIGDEIYQRTLGVLRRSLVVWLLLLVYIGLFWQFEYVGPPALVHMFVIIISSVVFLCGTGFYFSSHFRRTSTAVITNFILTVFVWGVMPFLVFLSIDIFRTVRYSIRHELEEYCLDAVPFVQAMRVMDDNPSLSESSCFIPDYILLGFFFAWRAKCRLRRNIF